MHIALHPEEDCLLLDHITFLWNRCQTNGEILEINFYYSIPFLNQKKSYTYRWFLIKNWKAAWKRSTELQVCTSGGRVGGGPSSTLARRPPLRNSQCLYPQSETIRLISHILFVFLERQYKTLLLYYKRVIQVRKQFISSSTKEKLMLIT